MHSLIYELLVIETAVGVYQRQITTLSEFLIGPLIRNSQMQLLDSLHPVTLRRAPALLILEMDVWLLLVITLRKYPKLLRSSIVTIHLLWYFLSEL